MCVQRYVMWVAASTYLDMAFRSEEYGHLCCSATLSRSHSCYQRVSEMCNSDGFIFSVSFGLFPWIYKVCFHYGFGNLVASEAHANCGCWRVHDIEQSLGTWLTVLWTQFYAAKWRHVCMLTVSLCFVFVGALFLKWFFARSVFYLYAHAAVGGNQYCIYDLSFDKLQLFGNKIIDTVASFDMSRYGWFVFGRCTLFSPETG